MTDNPEAHRLKPYPLFDWLRFVLASIVLLEHSGVRLATFLSGGLAVKVFFALSGWLIGGILLASTKEDMPRFFFNRATRIWIPYAVAILLLYGVAAFKEGVNFYWFKYLLLDVTFTHQLFTIFPAALHELPMNGSGNQFWSIAVEEQFYLFAPIVVLLLNKGKSLVAWLPIALISTVLDWHAASIALGVCAAILERSHSLSMRKLTRVIALTLVICCAGIMTWAGSEYIAGPLFAVTIVVLLAIPKKRSKLALMAGGLSYPLYLNQWLAGFAVHFAEKHWLALSHAMSITLIYLLAVVMAFSMYWLIDRQIQLQRNNWYTPERGVFLGKTAYSLVGLGLILGSMLYL